MKLPNEINRPLFAVLAFLLLAGHALGQTQTWSQTTPTGGPPAPRSDFGSAVFDPATDRMIVFGGGTPNPTPPSISFH